MIELIFAIKANANISLYCAAFYPASKSFNKFAFFENQGILGWSIMLMADWRIWRLCTKVYLWILKKVHSRINWQPLLEY